MVGCQKIAENLEGVPKLGKQSGIFNLSEHTLPSAVLSRTTFAIIPISCDRDRPLGHWSIDRLATTKVAA